MPGLKVLLLAPPASATHELTDRIHATGHRVGSAVSAVQDLSAEVSTSAPDLVLADMGSLQTREHLTTAMEVQQTHAVPFLFIGSEKDEARLPRDGFPAPWGYLAPPFGNRELNAHMELAKCRQREVKAAAEMEGFFNIAIDMFCFLDFNGTFKRLNPAWERTLGFTRRELMSRPFIDFVHADDRERTLEQNAKVRGGDRAMGFENRYRCKDGSYRWLKWNSSSLVLDGMIYAVARDITEIKQVEAERARLIEELQKTLAEVQSLRDILPICMYCKSIRDDDNYWQSVDSYIATHTSTRFSHGICPTCLETITLPEIASLKESAGRNPHYPGEGI